MSWKERSQEYQDMRLVLYSLLYITFCARLGEVGEGSQQNAILSKNRTS